MKCRAFKVYENIVYIVRIYTQTDMVRGPAGMLVRFIDFAKAHDKVDGEKLWFCMQSVGVNGRFLQVSTGSV